MKKLILISLCLSLFGCGLYYNHKAERFLHKKMIEDIQQVDTELKEEVERDIKELMKGE